MLIVILVTPGVAVWLFLPRAKGWQIAPRSGTSVNGVCKHVVNVRLMAIPCTVAQTSRGLYVM